MLELAQTPPLPQGKKLDFFPLLPLSTFCAHVGEMLEARNETLIEITKPVPRVAPTPLYRTLSGDENQTP